MCADGEGECADEGLESSEVEKMEKEGWCVKDKHTRD